MDRPIGVFDSGVGGLTVLKSLVELMPLEDYVYLGDTKNNPYGVKTPDEIRELSLNVYYKLRKLDIKMLVIACNTATVHGLKAVKEVADIPVVGVIDPGVSSALESNCQNILIIATDSTIDSNLIQDKLTHMDPKLNIEGIGCPDLVTVVEEGNAKNDIGKNTVKYYLDQADINPDCVMLSCTHFPPLSDHINEYYNNKVKLINPAQKSAEIAKTRLKEKNLLKIKDKAKKDSKIDFYTSGNIENFEKSGNVVLDGDIIISDAKQL